MNEATRDWLKKALEAEEWREHEAFTDLEISERNARKAREDLRKARDRAAEIRADLAK